MSKDFEQGDQVVLLSGGPVMTVDHTWNDNRDGYSGALYARCVYYNPVTGEIEKPAIKVALLTTAIQRPDMSEPVL